MNDNFAKEVDLHLHTHFSDGSESPSKVVERAKKMGISIIAITDHDGIGGVTEGLKKAFAEGIKLVSGTELSAFHRESFEEGSCTYFMHILGYGMDLEDERFCSKMEEINKLRRSRNEKMLKAFTDIGVDMDMRELESFAPDSFVGKRSFAQFLHKKGYVGSEEEAFRSEKYFRNPAIRKIHREKISANEAIDAIIGAGGIAVLAHPFKTAMRASGNVDKKFLEMNSTPFGMLEFVVARLKSMGLAGIEAYYPTHSLEETEFLLKLADRESMLVSKGSDDHGEGVRKVTRMGNFSVNADSKRLLWIKEF